MAIRSWCAVALALAVEGARADPGVDAGRLIDCVRANVPRESWRQTATFTTRDAAGPIRSLRAGILHKPFDDGTRRTLFTLEEPPDMQGVRLFVFEKNDRRKVYVHMRDAPAPMRVTAGMLKRSAFGTDFSFEDLQSLFEAAPGMRFTIEGEAVYEGTAVQVLDGIPQEQATNAYRKARLRVDAGRCVVLQAELFEAGDTPAKTLSVPSPSLSRVGAYWLAEQFEMQDHRRGTMTRVTISDVAIDVPLPDTLFELQYPTGDTGY